MQREIVKYVHLSSCKSVVIPVRIQTDFRFHERFYKILNFQISLKSVKWDARCSMRTDGDVTELIVAFRNFGNAPYNDPLPPLSFAS